MQLLELQNLLIDFWEQFCPNVRITGEDRLEDGGIDVSNLPLISFSYATSDFAENTMMTFDIWSYSTNWIEALSIEDSISKAIPSQSDTSFEITSGTIYEYRNPSTGVWTEFNLRDVQGIAQDIWDRYREPLDWREIAGEKIGGIWLQRGNPFTQSVPDVDFMIKRRTGNIIIRSFMIY